MSDKKYVVPIDMLRAVRAECYRNSPLPKQLTDEQILLAAIRWLSENPIVPTHVQGLEIMDQIKPYTLWPELYKQVIDIWQRRMFLAPEPEVPEELEVLLNPDWSLMHKALYRESILEAYRRGQKKRT